MKCDEVRLKLLDYQEGRLRLEAQSAVRAHLDGCPDCTRADVIERDLTQLLEHRLPQHPASLALKRRLRPLRGERSWWWARSRASGEQSAMVTEAVNDHLRLLASQHPLDVESGGLHQVKPWFAGRLDFAPVVTFEGDADFPLKGGSVGYFRDRKAAVFVYARRLHSITLLVFRADGLAWPARDLIRIGGREAFVTRERGFNVIVWRRGELGYTLVSDVDAGELKELAGRITPET